MRDLGDFLKCRERQEKGGFYAIYLPNVSPLVVEMGKQ